MANSKHHKIQGQVRSRRERFAGSQACFSVSSRGENEYSGRDPATELYLPFYKPDNTLVHDTFSQQAVLHSISLQQACWKHFLFLSLCITIYLFCNFALLIFLVPRRHLMRRMMTSISMQRQNCRVGQRMQVKSPIDGAFVLQCSKISLFKSGVSEQRTCRQGFLIANAVQYAATVIAPRTELPKEILVRFHQANNQPTKGPIAFTMLL